jgi:hypothetical protein
MFLSAKSTIRSTGQITARLRRLLTWKSQITLHNLDYCLRMLHGKRSESVSLSHCGIGHSTAMSRNRPTA